MLAKEEKMTTILSIIFIAILSFDIFMATPFGFLWTAYDLDNNHYCYGIIIVFVTAIPEMIIGMYLGIIQ